MGIDRSRYLTIQEAADKSGYTYEHLRRLVKSSKIDILQIDEHKYLIDYESVQRYMQEKPQRKPHSD